jgi:hypothetical protein
MAFPPLDTSCATEPAVLLLPAFLAASLPRTSPSYLLGTWLALMPCRTDSEGNACPFTWLIYSTWGGPTLDGREMIACSLGRRLAPCSIHSTMDMTDGNA